MKWSTRILLVLGMVTAAACNDNNTTSTGALNASPTPVATATPSVTPSITPAPTGTPSAVKQGVWNGQEISLNVADPASTIQLSCAHATITDPFIVNESNIFHLAGTITIEHGGPAMPGEVLPTYPASFDGGVNGDTMLMTITWIDQTGTTRAQDYSLSFNGQPNLHRCL